MFTFTKSSLPTPSLQFLFHKPAEKAGNTTTINEYSEYEYDYDEFRKKRNTVEPGINMTRTSGFSVSWFIRFSNGRGVLVRLVICVIPGH